MQNTDELRTQEIAQMVTQVVPSSQMGRDVLSLYAGIIAMATDADLAEFINSATAICVKFIDGYRPDAKEDPDVSIGARRYGGGEQVIESPYPR